jgi:hypothetical protein
MITIKYGNFTETSPSIKEAKQRAGVLAQENIGEEILVFKGQEKVWISKKKYADNDPVWNAKPNYEECKALWSSVVYQAVYDATCGEIGGDPVTDPDTKRNQGSARRFIKTKAFEMACEFANIDPRSIRKKINQYPVKTPVKFYEATQPV